MYHNILVLLYMHINVYLFYMETKKQKNIIIILRMDLYGHRLNS